MKLAHFFQVLQYQCGSEAGGPPDCLQYYTGTSGTVANFGFDTSQTDVAATSKFISQLGSIYRGSPDSTNFATQDFQEILI